MKEVILIITAYIMMIISGTQSLPEEAVSEIPAVVEKPAIVITEPKAEPEPFIPFQPVIEAPTVEEPEEEITQEIFIPSEPDPEPELQEEWIPQVPEDTNEESEPIVPDFDVSQHVSFAQSYGTDIGLILDSTAVSCWDNPIAAHSGCVYIDRDLRDLLDWYRICGYTHFWVWSEDLGNGNYNIYLGYA